MHTLSTLRMVAAEIGREVMNACVVDESLSVTIELRRISVFKKTDWLYGIQFDLSMSDEDVLKEARNLIERIQAHTRSKQA